jgi:hypothetical protein
MVDADANSAQSESHRGNTARRGRRDSIRYHSIGGICSVPEIGEMRALNIIQELIVARKVMRDRLDSFRGKAFDSSRCECRHPVKVGLAVGDNQITESREFYGRQVSRDERPRGIQRAVNAISSHVCLSSGIPVDHRALIPGNSYDAVRWIYGKHS